MRYEARAGVFVLWGWVHDAADDELIVGCEERVPGVGGVVLGFVVAPAVGASFLLEEGRDGGLRVEGGLPVRSCSG